LIKFAVVPVEPGILSLRPTELPFGRENGKPHQIVASKFP
jgi:hypothetical protein